MRCPDGYSSLLDMCARLDHTFPWEKAQEICENDNASLIFTKQKDEWQQLTYAIPQNYLTTMWYGLHYDRASDKWRWSDGSPFDPNKDWAPWYTGKPDTTKGECVVIRSDMWVMASCNQTRTCICIKPPLVAGKTDELVVLTGNPVAALLEARFTFPPFPQISKF